MTILADVFAAQSRPPDLSGITASPSDVTAAAGMVGWLSDRDERWIPLAVPA